MKRMILTMAAIIACGVAFAQNPMMVQLTAPEKEYIEVNARAYREVSPDEIFLGIVLDQADTKVKYTIDQLETQLYQALKKAGIDVEKDLRVSDMSSDYKTYLLKKNSNVSTKEYVLKVNNQQIMPVFRELDKIGVSNVNIQSARYSKTKELYNELIGEAVSNARERARIMATACEQDIDRLIYAQTYDNSGAYDAGMAANFMMVKARGYVAEMDSAMPSLEFNKIRIEANVTARFGIKSSK